MTRSRIFRGFLWVLATAVLCVGSNPAYTFDDTSPHNFRAPPKLSANAEDLRSTYVSSNLHVPIGGGKNIAWCATFQLAWNEVRRLIANDVRFEPPEDPAVAVLNQHEVNANDLDPESFLAIAGRIQDGIFDRIDKELDNKFHGAARPDHLPKPDPHHQPQDIVAYCYLFKNLDFPQPFERIDYPMKFAGSSVAVYGMGDGRWHPKEMTDQVSIVDYQNDNDFVVELVTRSPQDHLILAKISPGATLKETIDLVHQRRQSGKPAKTESADVLMIPKMNFEILRDYSELTGRRLISDQNAAPFTKIQQAYQSIRFLIDEKGVQIKSEAAMVSIGCSAPPMPHPEHTMIFDRPFLLMLERTGAAEPYFALWIENAELLEKVEEVQ